MKRTISLTLSSMILVFFYHTQTSDIHYHSLWSYERSKARNTFTRLHSTNQPVCKVNNIFSAFRNSLLGTTLNYSPDLSFFFWLIYSTIPKSSFIRRVLILLHNFCPNSLHLRKGHKKAHNTVIKMKTEREIVLKNCFIRSYSIKTKQCISVI